MISASETVRLSTNIIWLFSLTYAEYFYIGLVCFEPKEQFLPEEDQRLVAKTLMSNDNSLKAYLFDSNQLPTERYAMLTALIEALSKAPHLPVLPHSRPMLLEGHPFRPMGLDDAICILQIPQQKTPSPSIRELRDNLESSSHLEPSVAAHISQRLGESLLRRFWNLLHEDDLHEAIWALSDALAAIPTTSYRRLEIYLTLGTALFFRYQLLHQQEDLHMLLSVLKQQKECIEFPLFSMIWKGMRIFQRAMALTSHVEALTPDQHTLIRENQPVDNINITIKSNFTSSTACTFRSTSAPNPSKTVNTLVVADNTCNGPRKKNKLRSKLMSILPSLPSFPRGAKIFSVRGKRNRDDGFQTTGNFIDKLQHL